MKIFVDAMAAITPPNQPCWGEGALQHIPTDLSSWAGPPDVAGPPLQEALSDRRRKA
jgi:hypothetical protein